LPFHRSQSYDCCAGTPSKPETALALSALALSALALSALAVPARRRL